MSGPQLLPSRFVTVFVPRTKAQPDWPSETGGVLDLGSRGGTTGGELEALPPPQASMPAGITRSNEDESTAELTPPPDAPSVQPVPAVAPLRLLNVATPPNVDA